MSAAAPRGTVLVVGATSAIGRAVARRYAERAHTVVLAGRDAAELDRQRADLALRTGASARTLAYDAATRPEPRDVVDRAFEDARPAGVVIAHGVLDPVDAVVADPARLDASARVNFASAAALAEAAAERLVGAHGARGGFVAVVSSVAGDVGRRTNYPYGAAKAALSTYLQGLRGRVGPAGVTVVTVKPGFVDTAMTWGLVDPESPLVARADTVARALVRGVDRRARVVYAPAYWRFVMLVLKGLPEAVLHRLPI